MPILMIENDHWMLEKVDQIFISFFLLREGHEPQYLQM